MRTVRVLLLSGLAASSIVLAACIGAPIDEDLGEPALTTRAPQITQSASPSSSVLRVGNWLLTEDRLASREPGDVFALLELPEGGLAAGFGSSLDDPTSLPADAKAAVPDGRGGIVYVTGNEVWWISGPSADPQLIESPGIPVQMVGLRYLSGEPMVLVLIGAKLIGYDNGSNELAYAFEEFSGDVGGLAVDGDLAVGIVASGDGGGWVELVSMSTGELTQLTPLAYAEDGAAVLAVAISGDRIALLRRFLPVLVVATDGTEVGSIDLGISNRDVFAMDLAGDQLLVAFGESATATNIVSGERTVVRTREGRVLTAVWTNPVAPPPPPITEIKRFRVDRERVEADVDDPFLNVRQGPGVQYDLTAKLSPAYTGLSRTGLEQITDDGALWYEMELLDPVLANPGQSLEGRNPTGWVNSTYLEPLPEGLPVTIAEVPACIDAEDSDLSPAGSRPPSHVYALESAYLSSRCLRIVLTFGSGPVAVSFEEALAGLGPADALPDVRESMSGGFGAVVDLGGITSAWSGATETAEGVYIVRERDGLQLWFPTPVDRVNVHRLDDRGVIVIDLVVSSGLEAPVTGPGVALTRQQFASAGAIDVIGIGRPFEANLGVAIVDSVGAKVEVVFSGSVSFGTILTDTYAVQTADWVEAWAPFAVRAEGLAPGRYSMVLDTGGGGDDPRTLEIPFTISEPPVSEPGLATPEELNTVRSLVGFALGADPADSVPFAETVLLGLGLEESRTLARGQLTDPDSWTSALSDFDGYSGPFSSLATLARADFVRITSGPIPHCAGPPLQWPPALDGLRQINVEPIGGDSCLQWFGVSLFLNPAGEIGAVILDLFGP